MYDVTIVGAGIVGLATARALLRRHPRMRLAVLEKERAPATHQTAHNSGVVHSGIYYAPGSLKARLCIEGRKALLEYCDAKAIPYRITGKLIVAVDNEELPRLQQLFERGTANGIAGLKMIDAPAIRKLERYCGGIRAVFSPGTGIVDFGAVAASITSEIREMHGEILNGCEVTAIAASAAGLSIQTGAAAISTRALISCAGLYADRIARMAGGKREPQIVPFRGDYFVLKPERRYLVTGNIYPVPNPSLPFLGAHFTPRMDGSVLLGPNAVLAFAREGYTFTTVNLGDLMETLSYPGLARLAIKYPRVAATEMYRDVVRQAYARWLRRYIPALSPSDILPGPSGVRAQALNADGSLVDDFVFEDTDRAMHVRNAPSPAATASLAIGEYIADRASARFGF